MDWSQHVRSEFARLGRVADETVVEEMAQHAADAWAAARADGESPGAAEARVRGLIGSWCATTSGPHRIERAPLVASPAPGRTPFAGLAADVRDAIRSLRATPSFTIAAVVVLALGMGASTAIFSVVDAVVLRGLPFDEADRLVAVGERRPPGPGETSYDPRALSSIATPNYLDWVAQQQVFESIAAVVGPPFASFTLIDAGTEPEDVPGLRVTASFFDVLRIRPAIGRTFSTAEETEGQHRVAVLSDGLWRRRFGGNPAVIGRRIALGDGDYEVVGVMPPDTVYDVALSGGTARPTEILVPHVVGPSMRVRDPGGREMITKSIARLKPGVSIEQAQAQMDQIALALENANPVWNKDNKAGVRPLRDHLVGTSTKSWMLLLLGAVGIVLLIACANVANLMVARASTREREVAVRAALGASRLRLIRHLLVESVLLSTIGTALAIALARWAIDALRASMPEGVPRVAAIALDLRVFAAAAALSLLTALVFGVVPALQSSRPDLTSALKDGTRGASAGRGRLRLRSALVVAEVALAVVLLVGAALFTGSLRALLRIDPGFDLERVLTATVSPRSAPGGGLPNAFVQIVERVSQAPGVSRASFISGGLPLGRGNWSTTMRVPGREIPPNDAFVNARNVTADYHSALRIPLRSGRLFDATDRMGVQPVIIINESAARKFFPGENPVGRLATISREDRTIVGVVGDVHQAGLETDPRAEAYIPLAQVENLRGGGELVIRTSGDPYAALPAVKAAVANVLPDVPLRNVSTMEEIYARRTAQRRLNMLVLGLFGLVGLVISTVGLYGVVAYGVLQRTREIGVRMALGATQSKVVGMVLANAGALIGAGLIIGGAGAWYLSAIAQSFLFGVESTDPRAFVAAFAALVSAGALASIIPARRAASVDPVVALRAE